MVPRVWGGSRDESKPPVEGPRATPISRDGGAAGAFTENVENHQRCTAPASRTSLIVHCPVAHNQTCWDRARVSALPWHRRPGKINASKTAECWLLAKSISGDSMPSRATQHDAGASPKSWRHSGGHQSSSTT
eukprot:14215007-Alexandrium_andersonii.AAC.1